MARAVARLDLPVKPADKVAQAAAGIPVGTARLRVAARKQVAVLKAAAVPVR